MKKVLQILLLGILFTSFMAGGIPSVDVTIGPQISDMFFDKTSAGPGEEVTLFLSFTNNSDVSYVYIDLALNSSLETVYSNSLYFDKDSGYWQYTLTIDQYWDETDLFVYYVYYEDNTGSYYYYYNGEFGFPTPFVKIVGTTPDNEAPTINNWFFSSSPANGGERVYFYADITDNLSGVSYNYFELSWFNSTGGYSQYLTSFSASMNVSFGGAYTYYFTVENYWWNYGYYYISYYDLQDNAYNYYYWYNGTNNEQSPSFTVQNTIPDTQHPVMIGNPMFESSDAYQGTYLDIYFDIFDDNSGIDYAWADFREYNMSYSFNSYGIYFDEDAGLWKIRYYVPADTPIGFQFYIDRIYLQDRMYNSIELVSGVDFTSQLITVLAPPAGDVHFDFTPGYGESHLGDYVEFNLEFWSNYSIDVTVDVSFELTGPYDNYLFGNQFDLASYSYINFPIGVYFDQIGSYSLVLRMSVFGQEFSLTKDWNVIDPSGFDLSISPDSGVNDIGQEVVFQLFVRSYFNYGVDTHINLEVLGPQNFNAYSGDSYFDAQSARYIDVTVSFAMAGHYELELSATAEGKSWSYTSIWDVNEPPKDQTIDVKVSPHDDSSVVGDTVEFKVDVSSSFEHDMDPVRVEFLGFKDSVEVFRDESNHTLLAMSTIDFLVTIPFDETGFYEFSVTLWDDINSPWVFNFTWEVNDGSTDTAGNSTDTPSIDLPGFSFTLTLISFGAIMIATYRRRQL